MKKVLIVEDETPLRKAAYIVLEAHGFDTIEAKDGAEALEIMKKDKPDLVISDLLMPQLDGFELYNAMREDPKLRDIDFVLFTNYSNDVLFKKVINNSDLGLNDVWPKWKAVWNVEGMGAGSYSFVGRVCERLGIDKVPERV